MAKINCGALVSLPAQADGRLCSSNGCLASPLQRTCVIIPMKQSDQVWESILSPGLSFLFASQWDSKCNLTL